MTFRPPPVAISGHATDSSSSFLALAAVAPGFVMAMLDMSVLNVAISDIRRDVHASADAAVWIVDAYMLTFAALMFAGSALARRFGARNAYLAGVAWFIVASLACASATTPDALITARLLQGVGAAMLLPASLRLLGDALPDDLARPRVLGTWAVIVGVMAGIVPLVGGTLTTFWGWRSIFYLNVPVGIAAMLLARRHLSSHAQASHSSHMGFRRGELAEILANLVIFGDLFLLSLYLQDAPGSNPLHNGKCMFPLAAVVSIAGFASGRLSLRFGRSRVLFVGLSMAIAGCLVVACFGQAVAFWQIALPVACCNAGLGLAIPALSAAAAREDAARETPIATATPDSSRQIGALAGVTMIGVLLHAATPWTPRLREAFLFFAACLVIAGLQRRVTR